MKKRLCAALLCCLLLCSCSGLTDSIQLVQNRLRPDTPLAAVPYLDPEIHSSFVPAQTTFYYDQLGSDAARTIYAALLQHLADDNPDSLYLKGEFSRAEVSAGLRALQYDYPQLLCAPWGQRCSYYSTPAGTPLGIELSPGGTAAERADLRRALYAQINRLLAQAAAYSDPFERQVFLYDALIGQTDYDYDAAKSSSAGSGDALTELSLEDRLAHTGYGALVNQSAVCDGYASAFQLLCNYAGIEAATIIGRVQPRAGMDAALAESGTQDNHAWNLVQLADGAYYCDPTWDDNGNVYLDGKGQMVEAPFSAAGMRPLGVPVLHRYFNLTYEEISRNHRANTSFVYPQDHSTAYNYYVRNKLVAETDGELLALAQAAAEEASGGAMAMEFRLGFSPESSERLLTQCFGLLDGYDYLLSSEPGNRTGCYFVYLYS